MTKILPDEKVVYLALKDTFKRAHPQLRKVKKVREVILRRQHGGDVRDLIREHNMEDVCNVVKALLEKQIIESTLKLRSDFLKSLRFLPLIVLNDQPQILKQMLSESLQ